MLDAKESLSSDSDDDSTSSDVTVLPELDTAIIAKLNETVVQQYQLCKNNLPTLAKYIQVKLQEGIAPQDLDIEPFMNGNILEGQSVSFKLWLTRHLQKQHACSGDGAASIVRAGADGLDTQRPHPHVASATAEAAPLPPTPGTATTSAWAAASPSHATPGAATVTCASNTSPLAPSSAVKDEPLDVTRLHAVTSGVPAIPAKAAPWKIKPKGSRITPKPPTAGATSSTAPPMPDAATGSATPGCASDVAFGVAAAAARGARGRGRSRSPYGTFQAVQGGSGSRSGGEALPAHLKPLSRALSAVLRHQVADSGIRMCDNGFAPLSQVIEAIRKRKLRNSASFDVDRVVRMSRRKDGAPRFELCQGPSGEGCLQIRATRKHTMAGIGTGGIRASTAQNKEPSQRCLYSIRLSKALSAILRHRAPEEGIVILPDGWSALAEVQKVLRGRVVGHSDIQRVVMNSLHSDGTPRFEMIKVGSSIWIRATRNHSIDGLNPSHPMGESGLWNRLETAQTNL